MDPIIQHPMFRHPGFILTPYSSRKSALVHGSGEGLTDPPSHRARTFLPNASPFIFVSTYSLPTSYFVLRTSPPLTCFNASIWLDGASFRLYQFMLPKPSRYTMIGPGIIIDASGLDILVYRSSPFTPLKRPNAVAI